ncbi:caspase family protein [Sorangium sp. So ce291]|uniref:caspase family protein n=1 Tax=Sorangium sp. So ce291 TaxID=3133294 RepID=UPI003F613C13
MILGRPAALAAPAVVACGLVVASAAPAEARVERFAVLIGNNAGDKGEVELRYAEDDAAKMHDVLKDLGGFPPANLVLLRSEGADTVRRTLITMNDRVRAAMSSPDTDVLYLVYYSGHADGNALHLGPAPLSLTEFEQLVRGSAASARLLIVDSCRSGALTRAKGGTSAPPFVIRLDQRLAGQGMVTLASSSGNEDAQESDELKGSFFTHALVSGLLGTADVDRDGAVSLEEAYRHAYESTLRATSRTWAGAQHPTFRYDLRGQGKLVLTELPVHASLRGVLRFPGGRSYLVMRDSSEGPVAAEVGASDATRTLSLRPGRYFVRGRGPDFLLEGSVEAEAGKTIDVGDDRLGRVMFARLVRKGGGVREIAHGPVAGYQLRTPLVEGSSLCHGGFVGYGLELQHMGLAARLSACHSAFQNEHLTASNDDLGLDVRLSHAWDLPVITLGVGVDVGLAVMRQRFETQGYAPDRHGLAGAFGAGAGANVDLLGGFYLGIEAAAQTYVFKQRRAGGDEGEIAPSVAARLRVGVGMSL